MERIRRRTIVLNKRSGGKDELPQRVGSGIGKTMESWTIGVVIGSIEDQKTFDTLPQ